MCETKYYDKISQVSLWVEQPKPNVDEGDVMFILIFLIPCWLIVFVFLKPFPYVDINLSRVS